ncbi:MAG: GNAT family N-acetyltransferase [Gemmatimonas sp.]|jgi:GNAT superfamily N-acetyltransferase|uniref:GNAT family N-acetyltransferase n=1 Tax=Gemmatimonas sp. TaxID=1962908 RepID=UPI00391F8633|nr:GNAT family N-acetyltransferase [Gemmatimonadota bacterium]
MTTHLLSDLALARRLERAEAHANAAFVEARATIDPAVGAGWCDVDGAWAMFDGVGSPLTQTFGLGLFSTPSATQLEAIEAFFSARGADVLHEVSPMADPALLGLLAERRYDVIEWSTVLAQPVHRPLAREAAIIVRRTTADESDWWADIAAEGWGEQAAIVEFVRGLGRVSARATDTHCFVAFERDLPIATGALHVHDGVALFAGASTVPTARRRGAQRALLEARLQFAADAGCDLAMMVAQPGSTSQKNAQRAGFQVAYSRIKWQRGQHRP